MYSVLCTLYSVLMSISDSVTFFTPSNRNQGKTATNFGKIKKGEIVKSLKLKNIAKKVEITTETVGVPYPPGGLTIIQQRMVN